jgi:hypothetical protein
LHLTACADCGVGASSLGEWYMINDNLWEQAWHGRRKSWHGLPGQQVLCIGYLERRIGRRLTAADFLDVPLNDPNQNRMSTRLRSRLMDGRISERKSAQTSISRITMEEEHVG